MLSTVAWDAQCAADCSVNKTVRACGAADHHALLDSCLKDTVLIKKRLFFPCSPISVSG